MDTSNNSPSFLDDYLLWLLLAAGVSFLCVALVTPFVAQFARRLGAVDDPGGRRVHAVSTPRLGGLGIALGAFAGVLVSLGIPGIGSFGHTPLLTVFFATMGMLALGFIDDVRQVPALTKLMIQVVLAMVCWLGGVRVTWLTLPFIGQLDLIWPLSMALTVAWIVGITNAINLLDGLDGLASGVSAIVTTTLMLVGLMSNHNGVFLIFTAGSLGAACLGFLVHNRHPARIFMGDTGSLFLGFLLANVSVLTYRKYTTAVMLGIPILALGVPIADTLLAFTRRIVQGRSPFVPDRHHLHHVLHRIGISSRVAVIIIYSGTGLLCGISLLAMKFSNPRTLLYGVVLLSCGLTWLYALVHRAPPVDQSPPDGGRSDSSDDDTPVEGLGPFMTHGEVVAQLADDEDDFSDTDPRLEPVAGPQ